MSIQYKLIIVLMQKWSTSSFKLDFMMIKCNNKHECISLLTFEPLELCLAPVLTQCREELVHLLEGQWVVQRLQWIDGGHQGATFKPCSRFQITNSFSGSHHYRYPTNTLWALILETHDEHQANLMWPASTVWPYELHPTPFSHWVSRTVLGDKCSPKKA